jgi:hypothetical protein
MRTHSSLGDRRLNVLDQLLCPGVRIPESALREFIAAGLVEPVTVRNYSRKEIA